MVDETFKLSKEQLTAYLDRLGIEPCKPTKENLVHLQTTHISKIPYENLSIMMGESISLNGNDLFEKIIVRKRGGYCFEVNGLYSFLLKALGYKVTTYTTRFIDDENGVQMRRHRIMKVDFADCSYITDVSFRNEMPRQALKFVYDEIQRDGTGEYKFTRDDYYGTILWQKLPEENWKRIFGFDECPQSETDFILPNYYCETHPDSPFTKYPILSIFPPGRHIIISNHTVTIYDEKNRPSKKPICTEEEFAELCNRYFGIDLACIGK